MRKERFGTLTDKDKREKRKERFGVSPGQGVGKFGTKTASENEKKRKRSERFGNNNLSGQEKKIVNTKNEHQASRRSMETMKQLGQDTTKLNERAKRFGLPVSSS